jgi:hypothetical protein
MGDSEGYDSDAVDHGPTRRRLTGPSERDAVAVPTVRPVAEASDPSALDRPPIAPEAAPGLARPGPRRSPRTWLRLAVLIVVMASAGTLIVVAPGGRTSAVLTQLPPTVDLAQTALTQQARAIEAGDESGWLAPVDPALAPTYQELFRNLRALGVTSFQPVVDPEDAYRARQWLTPSFDLSVYFGFCAQTPTCPPIIRQKLDHRQTSESFAARLTWTRKAGKVVIVGYEKLPPAENEYDHLPWVDTKLEYAIGPRATVAASASLAARLPGVKAAAEAAAPVADKYARWVRPTRYIVYLADATEFRTWFVGPTIEDRGPLAYVVATSRSSVVVVVNVALIDSTGAKLEDTLRHEFGHVVTLLGMERRTLARGGFVEGIAEYIEMDGAPIASYGRLRSARDYVRDLWDGTIDDIPNLPDNAPPYLQNAMYGMGFLFWRCIDANYGQDKLLDFAGKIIRETTSKPDQAANETLGQSWATVQATCATYIRAATS